jgi:hypothetical protein
MADPERYVTDTEAKAELPFDEHDFPLQNSEQFSNALERALGAASDMVEAWGGTRYQPTDAETTFARPTHVDGHDLPLPKRPVQSVTSVEADGQTLTEGEDYVVHETHLELLDDAAIRTWPTGRRSITVSWSFGYEDVPAPVEKAIIRLARNALDQIETDGVRTEGSWTFVHPRDLKAECAAMVADYDAPSYYGGAGVL